MDLDLTQAPDKPHIEAHGGEAGEAVHPNTADAEGHDGSRP